MNPNRFQHLTEAFNSIIQMMLASLRVGGWRALLDLPNTIMAAIYLRRLGRDFAAIIASIDFSALSQIAAAAPTPDTAPARPASAPRPRAYRPRTGARRARPPAPAKPVATQPARQPAFARLRAPNPRPIPALRDDALREAERRS